KRAVGQKYKKKGFTPENYKQKTDTTHQHPAKFIAVDDEITFVKKTYKEVDSEHNAVSEAASIENSDQSSEIQASIANDNTSSTSEHTDSTHELSQELESCNTKIDSQMKENKELQSSLRELRSQSASLKAENEKLLAIVKSCREENKTMKASLSSEIEKSKKFEKELTSLKSKLSKETSQSLSLDEDNKKLKRTIESISKEKKSLVDQMMKKEGVSQQIETKIETEILELKNTLLREISELKGQIEKSVAITSSVSGEIQSQQPCSHRSESLERVQSQRHTDSAGISITEPSLTDRKYTAFVAGDSLTSILSRNKMRSTNLDVKIKSHADGRLQDLHNTIIRMAEEDTEFICNTDIVVIHGGTHNLSDGDSIDSLMDDYKQLAETVKCINSKCQVVISSILPRKTDKLANQLLKQVNLSLKQLCESQSYHFLNTAENFLKDGSPDISVYKDNIHLNSKGGKIFGESICHKLYNILRLPLESVQTSQTQNFQTGRLPGWRLPSNTNQRQNNGVNLTNSNRNKRQYNNGNYNSRYNRSNQNNSNNNQNNSNNSNNNRSNQNNIADQNNYNKQPWNRDLPPMMFMPMSFLPPWLHQNGSQVNMTGQ
ncbi:MAG: GDSL-type esterase/lipase family protein, partial [Candidatus Thiodiazotropha sp.]